MKTCSECGNPNDDDAKFCSKCGEYFETAAPAQPEDAKPEPGDDRSLAATADRLISELGSVEEIDDAKYASVLDECVDAAFHSASKPGLRTRNKVGDLAIILGDHDLITDMMSRMEERCARIGYQLELLNAASEYLFIAVGGFSVYTGLDDFKKICAQAAAFMDAMADRAPSLEPAQLKYPPEMYLRKYSEFFSLVEQRVDSMIEETDTERREFLSDYWSEKSSKNLTEGLIAAANMNIQLMAAGKLSSKIVTRARDAQLDAFKKYYMAPKQRSEEV